MDIISSGMAADADSCGQAKKYVLVVVANYIWKKEKKKQLCNLKETI